MRFLILILFIACSFAEAVTLKNSSWQIEIDPATLATSTKLSDGVSFQLSLPREASLVSQLKQDSTSHISWLRSDGTNIIARLTGSVLIMQFARMSAGKINWPAVPSGAKGLLLPLSEGSYILAMDPHWRTALTNKYAGINTTEGLSLPVVGLDYGKHVFSILFTNPFNNELTFLPDSKGIAVHAIHNFTSLDYSRVYEVNIALDGDDWLAPAKRYRQWAKDNGAFRSLKEKLAAAKDGEKLIGASHVYVWGKRLLSAVDVINWEELCKAITAAPGLFTNLDASGRKSLLSKELKHNRYEQGILLESLDQALKKQIPGSTAASYLSRKSWVKKRLEKALIDPSQWGEGASSKMIAALTKLDLPRLWIGFPQWEAGFANPEAIIAAKNAGYLIGPYDSYDTALPEGNDRPDWSSAQMGQDAFLRCGIVMKDGKKKSGFSGAGVYVNQACVRPLLEKRVREIQVANLYNSWFLDVAATGMVFDDYDPLKLTSEAQDAKNRQDGIAWIGRQFGIIVGSEDGHAVANSYVSFAHGLQSKGFGWQDKDMRKDNKSLYFLGRWWPSNQPETFFKEVSIKPEYKAFFFDPAKRVPLFQAAFHDSIVTTHHWTIDSLKFREARVSTELMQQLYNVPPLLNLSLETNAKRLPYLKKLDEFFRPLHQRLAYQALIQFRWKNSAGTVQETEFADGTRLIANFTKFPHIDGKNTVSAFSVLAVMPGGATLTFQSPSN